MNKKNQFINFIPKYIGFTWIMSLAIGFWILANFCFQIGYSPSFDLHSCFSIFAVLSFAGIFCFFPLTVYFAPAILLNGLLDQTNPWLWQNRIGVLLISLGIEVFSSWWLFYPAMMCASTEKPFSNNFLFISGLALSGIVCAIIWFCGRYVHENEKWRFFILSFLMGGALVVYSNVCVATLVEKGMGLSWFNASLFFGPLIFNFCLLWTKRPSSWIPLVIVVCGLLLMTPQFSLYLINTTGMGNVGPMDILVKKELEPAIKTYNISLNNFDKSQESAEWGDFPSGTINVEGQSDSAIIIRNAFVVLNVGDECIISNYRFRNIDLTKMGIEYLDNKGVTKTVILDSLRGIHWPFIIVRKESIVAVIHNSEKNQFDPIHSRASPQNNGNF